MISEFGVINKLQFSFVDINIADNYNTKALLLAKLLDSKHFHFDIAVV